MLGLHGGPAEDYKFYTFGVYCKQSRTCVARTAEFISRLSPRLSPHLSPHLSPSIRQGRIAGMYISHKRSGPKADCFAWYDDLIDSLLNSYLLPLTSYFLHFPLFPSKGTTTSSSGAPTRRA